MTIVRWFCAVALTAMVATPAVRAQDSPKPGPEHALLKKMEGNWDTTMKMAGMEFKGTATYKMDLGGLWLFCNFESMMGPDVKFSGRGVDGYDPAKKKYVSVWFDSMTPAPLVMEGTFDAAKKAQTMTGEARGRDGKMAKTTTVTVMPDDNTMTFSMYVGDSKEPELTIHYKRKK